MIEPNMATMLGFVLTDAQVDASSIQSHLQAAVNASVRGMGWNGMGRVRTGRDGTGRDGTGRDGIGWDGMGWDICGLGRGQPHGQP